MDILKERIPCSNGSDVECNVIETRVYYDLGGMNWATSEPKKRGYYISVSPLQIGGGFVRYQGFSGAYMLLKEVARQSKKAEEEAKKIYAEKKDWCIQRVCESHNITLIKE